MSVIQGIVIEEWNGKKVNRYILPPTPESYAFIEKQMKNGNIDPNFLSILDLWDSADETTQNWVIEVLTEGSEKE